MSTSIAALALPSGGALHIEGGGTAPPLLFFHGVGGGAWSWEPQRRHFAPAHAVYTWEARGHGAAARVADAGFADYVQDAREALAAVVEREGRDPFVIGHSMGGFVATILAAEGLPVRALALLDPVYNEDGRSHVGAPFRSVATALVGPIVRSAERDGRVARWIGRRVFAASFHDRAAMEHYWPAQQRQVPLEFPRMFYEGIAGVEGLPIRPYARDVRVPVLLINGRFPNLRDTLRAALGDAFLDEHIDAGHYLQLDAPSAVNDRLQRFFAQVAA
jgi:pimeloyl-ACP methyl ester carboxylesterase